MSSCSWRPPDGEGWKAGTSYEFAGGDDWKHGTIYESEEGRRFRESLERLAEAFRTFGVTVERAVEAFRFLSEAIAAYEIGRLVRGDSDEEPRGLLGSFDEEELE